MRSVIFRGLRGHENPVTFLCFRSHDLGGTDYEPIIRMGLDQARSVLSGTRWGNGRSGISSHLGDACTPDAEQAGRLSITQRPDPVLEGRNWIMHLTREGQAPEKIGYVSDEAVRELDHLKVDIDFPEGIDHDGLALKLKALRYGVTQAQADKMLSELSDAIGQGVPDDVAIFIDSQIQAVENGEHIQAAPEDESLPQP